MPHTSWSLKFGTSDSAASVFGYPRNLQVQVCVCICITHASLHFCQTTNSICIHMNVYMCLYIYIYNYIHTYIDWVLWDSEIAEGLGQLGG